ncbi:hypothetical protein DMUE_4011 [Dictyocoela muelleri]|nr:hypothetical protein DMUE_4011 [Dictyocoela muelleri]
MAQNILLSILKWPNIIQFEKTFQILSFLAAIFTLHKYLLDTSKKNNLIVFYKSNPNFRRFIKYLLLLAYIPEENILIEFKKLEKLFENSEVYKQAYEYFSNNFIHNENPTKIISFWSVHWRIINSISTTTNSCEAYHRHLNSKISKKNPELGKIIDILKKEEKRNKMLISNIKSGKVVTSKDKKVQIRMIVLNYSFYKEFEFFNALEELINIYY